MRGRSGPTLRRMRITALAALLLLLGVIAAGCAPAVVAPLPSSESRWIEEPFDERIERPVGEPYERCLGGSRFSPQICCSPSGAWEVHPSYYGEAASLCLVNRQLRLHDEVFILFSHLHLPAEEEMALRLVFASPLPAEDRARLRCLLSPRPAACFWAGDESGVFVLYRTGQFFFVTVPEGEATELNWDLRGRQVLASPYGTRDVVVLETPIPMHEDQPGTAYRLVVLDQEGRERGIVDEFQVPAGQTMVVDATERAIMLAMDPAPPGKSGWRPAYGLVKVYHLDGAGHWDLRSNGGVFLPALRGGRLTCVVEYDGQPWVQELSASGSAQLLFRLPERVVQARGDGRCRWNGRGDCLVFADSGVLVRVQDDEPDQPLEPPAPGAERWAWRRYDETYARLSGRYLRCLGWSPFPWLARWSPDGEWMIHPTCDGRGSICLLNPSMGVHRVLFSMADWVPLEAFAWTAIAHPDRPGTFFWAGDGSGVFLLYPMDDVPWIGFYVTVPDGAVTKLAWYAPGQGGVLAIPAPRPPHPARLRRWPSVGRGANPRRRGDALSPA